MEINTKYNLLTFTEFMDECHKTFSNFADTFNTKNVTTQKHCGWTDSLYEAQDSGWQFVIYSQARLWRYGFNGVTGEGLTLEEALEDHKVKYQGHLS